MIPQEWHVGSTIPLVCLFKTVNDSGKVVALNLNGATSFNARYTKPDGVTVGFFPLSIATDGTDGQTIYQPTEDDIDVAGAWIFQGICVKDGTIYKSNIVTKEVFPNIEIV